MKKMNLLPIMLFLLTFSSKAQIYAGAGAGTFLKKSKPYLAGQMKIGYHYKNYMLESGFHAACDNTLPVFFEIKAGRGFKIGESSYAILPMAGFVYQFFREDQKKKTWTASLEIVKKVNSKGGYAFCGWSVFDKKHHFITAGLMCILPSR